VLRSPSGVRISVHGAACRDGPADGVPLCGVYTFDADDKLRASASTMTRSGAPVSSVSSTNPCEGWGASSPSSVIR